MSLYLEKNTFEKNNLFLVKKKYLKIIFVSLFPFYQLFNSEKYINKIVQFVQKHILADLIWWKFKLFLLLRWLDWSEFG